MVGYGWVGGVIYGWIWFGWVGLYMVGYGWVGGVIYGWIWLGRWGYIWLDMVGYKCVRVGLDVMEVEGHY